MAETATWLAGDTDVELHTDIVKAIDDAYLALQIVSDVRARNDIVALLANYGGFGRQDQDRYKDVRGFIETIKGADVYRIDFEPDVASDEAIDAALDAWARKPGERANGAPTKWEATAVLLHESGFGRMSPDALEQGWKRRHK